MSKTRRPYPAAFREQIVELARAGRTPSEKSREFGPSAQSFGYWIAQAALDKGKPVSSQGLKSAERDELVRLRRENRQIKLERDILAKATAWFALRYAKLRSRGSERWNKLAIRACRASSSRSHVLRYSALNKSQPVDLVTDF